MNTCSSVGGRWGKRPDSPLSAVPETSTSCTTFLPPRGNPRYMYETPLAYLVQPTAGLDLFNTPTVFTLSSTTAD